MSKIKINPAEQKTTIPGIVKVGRGVLLNKDNTSLKAYKLRKQRERQIDDMSKELNEIKDSMDEIKQLLLLALKKD